MKKNLIFIVIILLYNYTTFAECQPNSSIAPEECPVEMEYPYKVCVGGKLTTECLANPNSRNGIIKMNLPIFYDFDDVWPYYQGNYYYSVHLTPTQILIDLETAFNNWNCICGNYISFSYLEWFQSDKEEMGNYDEILSKIPIKFSTNRDDFKDEFNDPTNANVDDEDPCYPNPPTMYFNVSKEFHYSGNFLMNDYHIHNDMLDDKGRKNYDIVVEALEQFAYTNDIDNIKIYNVIEVAVRQIGQILGMGESDECGCKEENIMSLKQVNEQEVQKRVVRLSVSGSVSGHWLFDSPFIIYDDDGNPSGRIIFNYDINNFVLKVSIYDNDGIFVGSFEARVIDGPLSDVQFIDGIGTVDGTFINEIVTITISIYRDILVVDYIPPANLTRELTDCDKCMFKNLYCPDYDPDGIYDYQTQTQKIYPNPGFNTVAFDFELPKYAESLKLSVMNPLGEVVLVPIENETFEQGEHSILLNVDRLPNGVYYIIIEAGAYRTAQPFTVVR